MGSFIDDMTAKVAQINQEIGNSVDSLRNLASTAGINMAPASPAPPQQPTYTGSRPMGMSNMELAILAVLVVGAVFVWKKL